MGLVLCVGLFFVCLAAMASCYIEPTLIWNIILYMVRSWRYIAYSC